MYKEKECKCCGSIFTPTAPCNLYCSDSCKTSAKEGHYQKHLAAMRSGVGSGGANKKGKEHHQYSTGKGFLAANRHSFRDRVRFCERCGEDLKGRTGRNSFCIHHRDHNHRNNPEDFSNWELLCVRCHHLEHKKQDHLNVQRLSKE